MARFDFDIYRKASTPDGTAPAGSSPAEDAASRDDVQPVYFTAEEAAAYMQLSLEAFQILAADPALKPVRILGVYHYRVADVQRFLLRMEAGEV